MTRIVLLGCAGSGKTTLARRLAERTGAGLFDLDALWAQQADGDGEAFRERLRGLHAGEAWISDGNFAAATFDIRLPRADRIVWLNTPRWLCRLRAVRRVFRPGEAHTLGKLREVLAFIEGFERVNRPRIEGLRQQIAPDVPVTILSSARQTEAFVARGGKGDG
jgi:adenylate kinase family enzyme